MTASENRGLLNEVVEKLYGYDVFISYTRQDDPNSVYALALHALLTQGDVAKKRKPMRCFLDTREMPHDEELKRAIEHNIFASRFVLIIAGAGSSNHPWMCFEAEMAPKHRKRILVLDRGISWKQSSGLLKTTVGDVLSIDSAPNVTNPGETEVNAIAREVGNLRLATYRRWIWASVTLCLAGFLVAAISKGLEASRERDAAQEQARIANARRLASESSNALSTNRPQLSVLLAVEAVKAHWTRDGRGVEEAEQSLRKALSVIGGRVITKIVGALAVSVDGNRLITWSDSVLRVWNLTEKDFKANQLVPKQIPEGPMAISPDNRWLVTTSKAKTALVWDLDGPAAEPILPRGQEGRIKTMVISPDNHWLVSASDDHVARLWDLNNLAANPKLFRLRDSTIDADADSVAISPDGRWLIVGTAGMEILVWDLKKDTEPTMPIELTANSFGVDILTISPNNHWLVTASPNGSGETNTPQLWDLNNLGANPVDLRGHDKPIGAVAISPDNHWLVTGSDDHTARLWNLTAMDPAAEPILLQGHEGEIKTVAISPDSRWLVSGSDDHTVRLWDLKTPTKKPLVLRGHDGPVATVAITTDSRRLVTFSFADGARLWDLPMGDLPMKYPAAYPVVLKVDDSAVNTLAFSQDNHWLFTGSRSGPAFLWDLKVEDPSANPMPIRLDPSWWCTAVAISPDSKRLVTAVENRFPDLTNPFSREKTLVWNLNNLAAEPSVLLGQSARIGAVAISSDNHWLVTGSEDHTGRRWDLTAKDPADKSTALQGHNGGIGAVAISPDSRRLVTGSNEGSARLWDLNAQDPAGKSIPLQAQETPIDQVAINRDDCLIVASSGIGTQTPDRGNKNIWLWKLGSEKLKLGSDVPATSPLVLAVPDVIHSVAISRDHCWLAVATGLDLGDLGNYALLWDLRARRPEVKPILLRGHQGAVVAVAISEENHWAVTASWDQRARLWDLTAKDPAASSIVLEGHEKPIRVVAFSSDSRWIITGSDDGTARLWPLRDRELVDLARVVVFRNLTDDESKQFFPDEKNHKTSFDLPAAEGPEVLKVSSAQASRKRGVPESTSSKVSVK